MEKTTVFDEVQKCFETKYIKQIVHDTFGTKPGSVIPSDYCYNITNNGIKKYRDYLHIFEQLAIGRYKYLGPNYRYSGTVLNKGIPVGKWDVGLYNEI